MQCVTLSFEPVAPVRKMLVLLDMRIKITEEADKFCRVSNNSLLNFSPTYTSWWSSSTEPCFTLSVLMIDDILRAVKNIAYTLEESSTYSSPPRSQSLLVLKRWPSLKQNWPWFSLQVTGRKSLWKGSLLFFSCKAGKMKFISTGRQYKRHTRYADINCI